MRTTCGNKEVPQTFFHNSELLLFAKKRFNPLTTTLGGQVNANR